MTSLWPRAGAAPDGAGVRPDDSQAPFGAARCEAACLVSGRCSCPEVLSRGPASDRGREHEIRGPFGPQFRSDEEERMGRLMRMVETGRFDPTPLITHRFSLEDIGEAYRVFSNRLDGVLKVAIRP